MDKSFFLSKLRNLNAEKAKNCAELMLSDFQRMYFEKYYSNPFPLRKSAVMVLLFIRNGKLKTLMIERTDIGTHAGQISFPGGKAESTDIDDIDTAIRETREEIGIFVDRNNIVAELPPVKVPVSKFEIFPIVAFVDGVDNIVKSESEVKKVLEVDVEELRVSLSNRHILVSGTSYDVPSFAFENYIVWGATSMILAELFSAIDLKN